MRTLTIQEVIKAIPLEESLRTEILKDYDSYDDSTKFEISHTCWNAFDDMYDALKENKYNQYTAEVAHGTRSFGENFMQTIDNAVWEDIEGFISGRKHETDAIEDVRRQLQTLIVRPPTQN